MSLTYDQLIKSKHKALAERSFKTRLEMFLFHRAYYELNLNFQMSEFLDFQISDQLISIYERSFNMDLDAPYSIASARTISDIEKLYTEWTNKCGAIEKEMKQEYTSQFSAVLSVEELMEVYPASPEERKCEYTNLTDLDIEKLRIKGLIKTKRSRGVTMEIDRLNSNQEYRKDNIVLACYWANNAKTDEFTMDEFKYEIGPAIERVFQKRISKEFGDPESPSYVRGI